MKKLAAIPLLGIAALVGAFIWARPLSVYELKELYLNPYQLFESPHPRKVYWDFPAGGAVTTRRYSLPVLGVG